jgi:hypothetical protein
MMLHNDSRALKSRSSDAAALLAQLHDRFPGFVSACTASRRCRIEQVQPGASNEELRALETKLRLPLPESYRAFLQRSRGFWLFGGAVQFGKQHPSIHKFPKFEELSPRQREVVALKGGAWPPPSEGMICFAEYFRDADGDQVLVDGSNGLIGGEYPIVYYSHDSHPPFVEVIGGSFSEWLDKRCVQEIARR